MEWINAKEQLPIIPEGRYGIRVLVAMFDSVYEELNPGHGYEVHEVSYGIISGDERKFWQYPENIKKDFMQLYTGLSDNCERGPCSDEVTHWMLLPDPPKRDK